MKILIIGIVLKSSRNSQFLADNGVVPIINENDSISDEEIKFGDNVLSALLASLGKADFLVILSTAMGLMTNPSSGKLIPFVAEITPPLSQWRKELLVKLLWEEW